MPKVCHCFPRSLVTVGEVGFCKVVSVFTCVDGCTALLCLQHAEDGCLGQMRCIN